MLCPTLPAQSLVTEVSVANLATGDLIFVGAREQNISGAINRVTQRVDQQSFDHVGLVEVSEQGVFLLHATGRGGAIRQHLEEYVALSEEAGKALEVYRLKDEYVESIPIAITVADSMLGKPYNFSYVLNDSSYYCSDYIERAFRKYEIFELEPMTFVNPETGDTDEFWQEFYNKMGIEVPEGELGCNPNGLAASEKLVFVGTLR